MAIEPKQTASPVLRETGTVHIKAAQAAQIKLEEASRLVGDPRKGVGVAATTGHPPTSGIFGS